MPSLQFVITNRLSLISHLNLNDRSIPLSYVSLSLRVYTSTTVISTEQMGFGRATRPCARAHSFFRLIYMHNGALRAPTSPIIAFLLLFPSHISRDSAQLPPSAINDLLVLLQRNSNLWGKSVMLHNDGS